MLFNTFPISKLSNYTRTCSFTNRVATTPVPAFLQEVQNAHVNAVSTRTQLLTTHAHTNPMEHTRMYATVLTLYTKTREYEDENLLKSSQNFDKILPVVEA